MCSQFHVEGDNGHVFTFNLSQFDRAWLKDTTTKSASRQGLTVEEMVQHTAIKVKDLSKYFGSKAECAFKGGVRVLPPNSFQTRKACKKEYLRL